MGKIILLISFKMEAANGSLLPCFYNKGIAFWEMKETKNEFRKVLGKAR